MANLYVTRVSPSATLPTRATPFSAELDIDCCIHEPSVTIFDDGVSEERTIAKIKLDEVLDYFKSTYDVEELNNPSMTVDSISEAFDGNVFRDEEGCKLTTYKYQVTDGVITLLNQPLPSLEQWLMYNGIRNGVFETDGNGLVWANGDVYEPETYIHPTSDKYQVVDTVNSPSHYASGDIECIDAIKASMTREAFLGYLKGNIQKYMWRYEKKINPLEDVKKARWHMNKLVDELDK